MFLYRKRKYPLFIHEFTYADLEHPVKRQLFWKRVNEMRAQCSDQLKEKQRRIQKLERKLRVLQTCYGIHLMDE